MLRWKIDVNDEEHPLVENTTLSKMDLAQRLIPKYDDYCKKCKKSKVKWPCLDNFMFRLLPFLSEIFVQDGVCRTPAYPAHQTSLHSLKVFTRHAKWAKHQREKLMKKADELKSEAMARKDRNTKELFSSVLNEVTHMRNRCNGYGIVENNSHPNSNIKI